MSVHLTDFHYFSSFLHPLFHSAHSFLLSTALFLTTISTMMQRDEKKKEQEELFTTSDYWQAKSWNWHTHALCLIFDKKIFLLFSLVEHR